MNELYRDFLKQLRSIYSENESAKITQIIFEKSAGIHRIDIVKNPTSILSEDNINQLQDQLSLLMMHHPVQYVVGQTDFYHCTIKVNPAVLIPRPETEELVKKIIDDLNVLPRKQLLDIGCGSGCISIAIKKNIPNIHVTSIDISLNALKIAAENAALNKVNIELMELDFIDESNWGKLKKFDVITSNPPYIPEIEKSSLDENVRLFEPGIALFVRDSNPLIFYQKILDFSKEHLDDDGKIYAEIHENNGKELLDLFKSNHFNTQILKDSFGKDRFLEATRYPKL